MRIAVSHSYVRGFPKEKEYFDIDTSASISDLMNMLTGKYKYDFIRNGVNAVYIYKSEGGMKQKHYTDLSTKISQLPNPENGWFYLWITPNNWNRPDAIWVT
jgi:hypothetical protein